MWLHRVGYQLEHRVPAGGPGKTLYVPFEDAEFPIPAGYDRILRHTYGDYMTPPPPEQRIGQHFYTVWPKEQGAAEEHKEGAIS